MTASATPMTDAARANCTGAQIDSMPAHIWQVMERLEHENARLKGFVATGLEVVDDFLPNIGRCALQDYGRLNDFCIKARRATIAHLIMPGRQAE